MSHDEARSVLKAVWSATGQSRADLDESLGTKKSCKNMVNVGFGDLDDADADVRTAWRERLQREGKLNPTGSIRDLVLGPEEPR